MWENKWFNYSSRSDKRNCEINQLLITSKEFWFIEWLVENEKIDTNKLEEKSDFRDVYYCFQPWKWKKYYDVLIMLLAIQDEPIEFLISILKNV